LDEVKQQLQQEKNANQSQQLQAVIGNLNQQLSQADSTIIQLTNEKQDIQDKLNKAGKTGKNWKSKYDKSRVRCQQLAEEKENLTAINNDLTNELEDKVINEELLQRDNEVKNKSLTAEIRGLKGKLTRLNKKLSQQLKKEKY
jgi:hypothetical protein